MTTFEFSLLGVNGDAFDLQTAPVMMATSPQVFGMAPVSVGVRETPALTAGSMRGRSRVDEWPIILPIRIRATDQQELVEQVERLAAAVDPTRGDCVIQVTRPDGEAREIAAHYTAGLVPAVESCDTVSTRVDLVFRAPTPFWSSVEPDSTTLSFPVTGTGAESVDWDDAVLWDAPLPWDGWTPTTEGGTVLVTLNNSGTAAVWPRWDFHGATTGITATNLTTGRVWAWTAIPFSTLSNEQTVTIDTNELSRTVRTGTGENRYRGLQLYARDLWPLEPGDNVVLLQVAGADTFTTAEVVWRRRWLTC